MYDREARELTRCHQCHGTGTVGGILSVYQFNTDITLHEIISTREDDLRAYKEFIDKCKTCGNTTITINEFIPHLEDELRKLNELKCKTCDGTGTGALAHLLRRGRFEQEPGVEVIDAGNAQVNGWYVRKEAAEGPPRRFPHWDWTRDVNEGWHWYEKDDGSTICRDRHHWYIRGPSGRNAYDGSIGSGSNRESGIGFAAWRRNNGAAPAPTLLVVN